MSEQIIIPTGPKPGWELEEAEKTSTTLHSVADSMVILHALKQSRERWLSTNFVKFPTNIQGNKASSSHTCISHGLCKLQIGPIIFYDTAVFEIRYSSSVDSSSALTSNAEQSATLVSPHTSGVAITPELLAQVHVAAGTNPTLAKLLQLAAAEQATSEQLHALGVLIQQLAISVGQSSTASPPKPVAPSDFVIEYRERPGERFLIPRELAICEREPASSDSNNTIKLCVTISVKHPKLNSKGEDSTDLPRSQPVKLLVTTTSESLEMVDFIERWADASKFDLNKRALDALLQSIPRVYLQHRLPDGPLLTQIRAANASPYTMRSLDPSENPLRRIKRRNPPINPQAVDSEGKANGRPLPLPTPNMEHSAPEELPIKRRKKGKERAVTFSTETKPDEKKRKRAHKQQPIACRSCGTMDVPLLLNGHYCRSCIDNGHIPASAMPETSTIPRVEVSIEPFFSPERRERRL